MNGVGKLQTISVRLKKELEELLAKPPVGISCVLRDGTTHTLDATIIGSEGSPYEGGIFRLEVVLPFRYPFAPPVVSFKTPIYHPNIDESGRICLDVLKMPPVGNWRCAMTLENLLTCIQALMNAPNPDDPLMPEIAELYKVNRKAYDSKARKWTHKFCDLVGGKQANYSDEMDCDEKAEDDDSDDEKPPLKKCCVNGNSLGI